jgi:hypothetical protein
MSKSWIREKRPQFVRDVLREFCLSCVALEEELDFFDAFKRLRFANLRDLLGEEMSKGLLWRLKDTAHHLFRNPEDDRPVGKLLDWSLGYIFHETIKLKEDAYQQQNYAPLFRDLQSRELSDEERLVTSELVQVIGQTRESIQRETRRIRFILYHCRRLFPVYLQEHSCNLLLARFVYEHEDLMRRVFGGNYEDFLNHVWGAEREMLYILASRSLRQGGRVNEAMEAVDMAVSLKSNNPRVLQEKEIVGNWKERLIV